MISSTALTIILIAVGLVILINLVFSAFSVIFIVRMLQRMEGMYKELTGAQYDTLTNVVNSYRGICENYHSATEILKLYVEEIKDNWRTVIFPSNKTE